MPLSLLEGLPSSLLDAVCLPSSNAACRRRRRMTRKPAGQQVSQSDASYGKPARMCPEHNNQEKLVQLGCSVSKHTGNHCSQQQETGDGAHNGPNYSAGV